MAGDDDRPAPTKTAATAEALPSPWKRRLVIALLWTLSAALFLCWLIVQRVDANGNERILKRTIDAADTTDRQASKADLLKTFTAASQSNTLGVSLLALAYLLGAGAAVAAPIWSAIEARRGRANGGRSSGGGS